MPLLPQTTVLGNFFVIVLAGQGGHPALRGLATVGIIAPSSPTAVTPRNRCASWPRSTSRDAAQVLRSESGAICEQGNHHEPLARRGPSFALHAHPCTGREI